MASWHHSSRDQVAGPQVQNGMASVTSAMETPTRALTVQTLFDVADTHVVITGGSRGIGLMIAHGFVANGAHVYVVSRKQGGVDDAVGWLTEAAEKHGTGGSAAGLAADVATEEGVAAVAEWVLAQSGGVVHTLVNNAGTNWSAPLEEYPIPAFEKVLALNVTAAFALTQAFRQALISASGRGSVINIGSINGLATPKMETYAYSTSKAAIHHLTRHTAAFLAEDAVRVNAVAPGPFASKMMKHTLDTMADIIVNAIPLARIGDTPDMAGVCLYLASPAASYVTGAVIPVDGGALVAASAL